MVNTIPTVSRAASNRRWISTAFVHGLASVLAAITFGTLLSLFGLPVARFSGQQSLMLLLVLAALLFGLAELRLISLPRPQRHRQVPAQWRSRFPPEVMAAFYGAILGMGIFTRIPFASFYVLLIWVFVSGDVLGGAIVFGVFGLARAAPPVLLSPFLRSDESAYQLTRRLMPFYRDLQPATGLFLLTIAVFMLAHTFYL